MGVNVGVNNCMGSVIVFLAPFLGSRQRGQGWLIVMCARVPDHRQAIYALVLPSQGPRWRLIARRLCKIAQRKICENALKLTDRRDRRAFRRPLRREPSLTLRPRDIAELAAPALVRHSLEALVVNRQCVNARSKRRSGGDGRCGSLRIALDKRG
jgi:hypothetical protein